MEVLVTECRLGVPEVLLEPMTGLPTAFRHISQQLRQVSMPAYDFAVGRDLAAEQDWIYHTQSHGD